MNAPATQTLGGVAVPDTPLIDRAIRYARSECAPWLFNHVMRSWLFAARIGQLKATTHDGEVLAVGTVLHDITLNDRFAGPRRFEVEAADFARSFVVDAGFDGRRAQLIWDSVALNSTASIALYKEAEVALCTAGICLDVIGLEYDAIPPHEIAQIVEAYPRRDMKERMTQCFCHIAATQAGTTYDNFVRDFGERFVAGYAPPSSVDFVANAPFDS